LRDEGGQHETQDEAQAAVGQYENPGGCLTDGCTDYSSDDEHNQNRGSATARFFERHGRDEK